MFIVAIIIYVILSLILGPIWPLYVFGGKGPLLRIVAAAWILLLFGGLGN